MRLLAEYRDQLGIPPHFAAPLGVKWPGGMHILAAIRGLFWQGNDLYLPAGCGVVQGSTLEGEWAELELKRRWIHRAFGV
jgi:isochorismate synthase EntC